MTLYQIYRGKHTSSCLTLVVKLHPGNVVTNTFHLPAWQSRLHHGQVGFAAGAREGRRHVTLHSLRVGDTQDLRRQESVH